MRWASRLPVYGAVVGLGCSSLSLERRVVVSGVLETAAGDTAGTVTFSVHHAWLGDGLLRHPMAFVDSVSGTAPGAFSVTVDVPMDEGGEGLVLYAWHDRDEDGVLCSMDGDREELAGAVWVPDWPTYEANVALRLEDACAGPETFVFDRSGQRRRGSTRR